MVGINGQGGFNLGERARETFDQAGKAVETVRQAATDAAEAAGVTTAASRLEQLVATASPLERLAEMRSKFEPALNDAFDKSGIGKPLTLSDGSAQAIRDFVSQLFGASTPTEAPAAQPVEQPKVAQQPGAQTPAADPKSGGLSPEGFEFLYQKEAQAGVSNKLHWPGGGSGVTLGPGYDMKGRTADQIKQDLIAVGVDSATAEQVSRGAGLQGNAAKTFAANNKGLVDLNPAQERLLMQKALEPIVANVRSKVTVPLTQNQFDALVSFSYNIGVNGFNGSTALTRLNAGDTAGVGDAMKMWNKSDGRVNQGVINRRNAEVELFNTPGGPANLGQPKADAPARTTAPTTSTASASDRSPQALAAIIERSGDAQSQADLAAGRKVVVAVRTPTDADANGGTGRYDDTIAVVWKDASGNYQARAFDGNTEPSAQYRFDGPKASRGSSVDLNGDGRMDLGQLKAGTIRYTQQDGEFSGNTFFRADRTQVSQRDVNGDGKFDAADGNNTDPTGAGRSMLIHQGGTSNTYSAGCQTMAKGDFNSFVAALGGQKQFSYVLVDAN